VGRALDEHEAKRILAGYGIPVVREIVARDAGEALAAARELGFPVVVKGLGPTLLHKTERSLVHLNICGERELKRAVQAVAREAADELEGILVQPCLSGRRELVAGFSRDPVFGPVVMFGIGGIFTEALKDISLRLAPLKESDAEDMLDEIKAGLLLGPFREEQPADREALVQTLLGLSRLAVEHPEFAEADINPLIVTPAGDVRAVDALLVRSAGVRAGQSTAGVDPAAIGRLFYPKSIAFIGASQKVGKWGHMLMSHTINGGFPGDIFLVNDRCETIAGRPVYQEITDVPGKVDLAVVTIPASKVLELLPKLKDKGILNVLLISSGFGESGPEGRELQKKLVEQARKEGLLVLGPNTMGISNPYINLYCTGSAVRPRPGGTAMVAQSGNMGVQLLGFAEEQGIGIRCFCGSGNEAMITVEDFIDGFAVDDPTRIVMLYVEGVHDGRRFFNSARRLSRKKPIVLLKGGQTEAGNRAASSHTGAMASDGKVFDAVCRQAGIMKVEQSMDLLDLAAAFSSLPLPGGNRVGIMTFGGGWGVLAADMCSRSGLVIPELPPELIGRFDSLLPPYWSRSNPVDIVGEFDSGLVLNILEELMKWNGCDSVISLGIMGRSIYYGRMADAAERADPTYSRSFFEKGKSSIQAFEQEYLSLIARLMVTYQKPVYGVSLMTDADSRTVHVLNGSPYYPVIYPSPERAVKANARMYEYFRFLRKNPF